MQHAACGSQSLPKVERGTNALRWRTAPRCRGRVSSRNPLVWRCKAGVSAPCDQPAPAALVPRAVTSLAGFVSGASENGGLHVPSPILPVMWLQGRPLLGERLDHPPTPGTPPQRHGTGGALGDGRHGPITSGRWHRSATTETARDSVGTRRACGGQPTRPPPCAARLAETSCARTLGRIVIPLQSRGMRDFVA